MANPLHISAPGYRPEIDGLRAVAVLSVVFYHFGFAGFSGGFVGVDVFFVISGYLIGGLLWAELESTGRISLKEFYIRRIRRLMPAYFVMATATLIAAWFILLPFEFRAFGKSLIAATVYLSNVQFWREAGYFDGAAEDKVLLHTWSLSVEEQFYIFLPLLIILLARWRTLFVVVLCLSFLASLSACIVMTKSSHTAAFYLFPFRAWEMLAGVLLAIFGQRQAIEWRVNPAMSWLGIALILGAVFTLRPGTDFPGALALSPVLGAFLIILNGRDDNIVNRVLSNPFPVTIGLFSYSLYIWHWPILTLGKYWRDGFGTTAEMLAWLAATFVVSIISWKLIETPFRRPRSADNRVLVGSVVTASVVLISAGFVIWQGNGLAGRFPDSVATHVRASADFNQDWSRCEKPTDGPFAGVEICPIGPSGAPEVLVWGDSHVRALKEGLEQAAYDHKRPGLLIWHAGCPPLFDVIKVESAATRSQDADCTHDNQKIRDALASLPSVQRVLLIGRWAYYRQGQGVGVDAHNQIDLFPIPDGSLAEMGQQELFDAALSLGVSTLSSTIDEVYVLRQLPEFPRYDSRSVARALAHGRLKPSAELEEVFLAKSDELAKRAVGVDQVLVNLAGQRRIVLLDPWPEFCDARQCSMMHDGQSMYFDNNHVTNDTALKIRHVFDPFFADSSARRVRGEDGG